MAETLTLECESVRDAFREWQAEQESLDAQLSESLSALAAYQSHLDSWQQQLAQERDELRASREQWERDRAVAEKNLASQAQTSHEMTNELSAARDRISSLNTDLQARAEELQATDQRRAELIAELELSRGREKELQATLAGQQRALDEQRAQWAEEMRQLRETLQNPAEAFPPEQRTSDPAPEPPAGQHRPSGDKSGEQCNQNPVLGSIVEQFGKLRQQRAFDRQALKKAR